MILKSDDPIIVECGLIFLAGDKIFANLLNIWFNQPQKLINLLMKSCVKIGIIICSLSVNNSK